MNQGPARARPGGRSKAPRGRMLQDKPRGGTRGSNGDSFCELIAPYDRDTKDSRESNGEWGLRGPSDGGSIVSFVSHTPAPRRPLGAPAPPSRRVAWHEPAGVAKPHSDSPRLLHSAREAWALLCRRLVLCHGPQGRSARSARM
eukprot:scaffold2572_cov391-Prasinococcus_capsulatus_cf.AAC.4